MLAKSEQKPYVDLSAELNDELDWKAGTLRALEHHLDISAWAYEAVSSLLAIGTYSCTYPTLLHWNISRNKLRDYQPLRRSWRGISHRAL